MSFVYIRKIMFLYYCYCFITAMVYITAIVLLDSCMGATICRKKDSACMTCMCIAHWALALSPERQMIFYIHLIIFVLYYLYPFSKGFQQKR